MEKFHIGVEPESHELILAELTDNGTADCEVMPKQMVKAPSSVENVYVDGAYDMTECRKSIKQRGATAIIPPDRNAVVPVTEEEAIKERNDYIMEITGLGGEEGGKLGKKLRGYYRRSNGETAMFRFKKFFGELLSCRSWENQLAEVNVKSLVMNILTRMGMPAGRWAT